MRRSGCLRYWFVPLLLLLVVPGLAQGQWRLGDIYDDALLHHWQERYRPNVQWNFDNLVLGRLTPAERARVGTVTLAYPLRAEGTLRDHPLQFYAGGDRITVPVLSLKFLDDLTLAWAFLHVRGRPLDPVMDYLAMLRYQDPASTPKGRFQGPLETLGVPPDIWKRDPAIDDISQKAFKSAVVWILAHELGHLYHRHPGYGPGVSRDAARANETEADQFANTIMRRIGVAPLGIVQYFMALSRLERGRGDFTSQAAYERYVREVATHPLTSDRLRAIAGDLRRSPEDFTAEESDPVAAVQRIRAVADDVDTIAGALASPDMHRLVVAIGLATTPESLASADRRRVGVAGEGKCAVRSGANRYDGVYEGVYGRNLADGSREWLPAGMELARAGRRVVGKYWFGAGEGTVEGLVIRGQRLQFEWTWGTASGRGTLRASSRGGVSGEWGHDTEQSGGGVWDLCYTPRSRMGR